MQMLALIAIIPVILLLYYVNNKDINREPKKLLKNIFWYGVLTVIPVLICELLLDNFFSTDNYSNIFSLFISVFFSVALVEEFFKWIVVRFLCYNNKEFDEIYDAIVYTTYSSLGFACVENLLFVFIYGTTTGIFRALSAVPGHACYGVIMGYNLGLAKYNNVNRNKNKEKKYLLLSILIPTLLHTIYDFMIYADNIWLYFMWFIYIIVLFVYSINIIKKVSNKNDNFYNSHNYCGNCGRKCTTTYCKYCGYKNL